MATLPNLDPTYLSTVEPPLMIWSGNATLSPATALTTPQEFFLGSQYPAGVTASVTKLSLSNRWAPDSSIRMSGSDTNSPATFLLPVASGGKSRCSTKPLSRP